MSRCETCGAALLEHQIRCSTCGTPVADRAVPMVQGGVQQCPRCGVQGGGVPYFRKGSHVGLLVGLSMFTSGVGGVLYYLARRKHLVCRGCGLGWEHARPVGAATQAAPRTGYSAASLPPSGLGRRVVGTGLALLATLLITVGIVEFALPAVAVGSVFGLAGSATFWWGWKALQERRHAVLQDLNQRVILLATERGGVLTVTEVAATLNLSLPAAEKVMQGLDDGFRVRSDISKEGVLFYEFPEVRHKKQLGVGESITGP